MARNEKTPDTTTPETETVNWRLPVRIASDNEGDWTPLREHLEAWANAGGELDVPDPDTTQRTCLRMPTDIVQALDKVAKQLAKKHGKRYTAGYVARLVWDLWEPS